MIFSEKNLDANNSSIMIPSMHVKPTGSAVYISAKDSVTKKMVSTTVYGVPVAKVVEDIRNLYSEKSTKPRRKIRAA